MELELNKTHNMSCLNGLKLLGNNIIDLLVTSSPYYNAREYAQWDNIEMYVRKYGRDFF